MQKWKTTGEVVDFVHLKKKIETATHRVKQRRSEFRSDWGSEIQNFDLAIKGSNAEWIELVKKKTSTQHDSVFEN